MPRAPPPARTTQPISGEPLSAQRKVTLHRVPGHAAWFRYDAVHDVEKQQLPEFFDGRAPSKTPQVCCALNTC